MALAIARAADDNQVSILAVSFGECEAYLGAAGNPVYNNLYEQAAAQGITVPGAAGDGGPAGCDARIECIASGTLQGRSFVTSIESEGARPARMPAHA